MPKQTQWERAVEAVARRNVVRIHGDAAWDDMTYREHELFMRFAAEDLRAALPILFEQRYAETPGFEATVAEWLLLHRRALEEEAE